VALDGHASARLPQACEAIASRTALSTGGIVESETIQSGRAVDGVEPAPRRTWTVSATLRADGISGTEIDCLLHWELGGLE
jgi:hypothetical protein